MGETEPAEVKQPADDGDQKPGETRVGARRRRVRDTPKTPQKGYTLVRTRAGRALVAPGEGDRPTYHIGETGTYVADKHLKDVQAAADSVGVVIDTAS